MSVGDLCDSPSLRRREIVYAVLVLRRARRRLAPARARALPTRTMGSGFGHGGSGSGAERDIVDVHRITARRVRGPRKSKGAEPGRRRQPKE